MSNGQKKHESGRWLIWYHHTDNRGKGLAQRLKQMLWSWWELLSQLFVKFTPVPSSAAVERFVSQGKNILSMQFNSEFNRLFV